MGEKITADAEFKNSFMKSFQGVMEPFVQFIGKLSATVQVKGKEIQEYLIRQLDFENANKNWQSILYPIRKREDMMGYMKAC